MEARKTYPELDARLGRRRVRMLDRTAHERAVRDGLNIRQYHTWEGGARRIPVEPAERLADASGLSVDWIYRVERECLSEHPRKVL